MNQKEIQSIYEHVNKCIEVPDEALDALNWVGRRKERDIELGHIWISGLSADNGPLHVCVVCGSHHPNRTHKSI